ncbi:MAG: type II RES/Xre toxin-antitoxin system antitoxin [Chitinophagaceae bacterium]
MKKKTKPKKVIYEEREFTKVEEPVAGYRSLKIIPAILDFPHKKFEKIASKVPFTQKEWAAILHLSEKTLQRYSKDNKSFEGIYVDRILQIEELIALGLEAFSDANSFYEWLKKDKAVLGELLNFDSLKTTYGIGLLRNQVGRILHTVYI